MEIWTLISIIPITIGCYIAYDLVKKAIIRRKNYSFRMLLLASHLLGYDVVQVYDPKKKMESIHACPPNMLVMGAPPNQEELLRDIQKFVDILGAEVTFGVTREKFIPKKKKTDRKVYFHKDAGVIHASEDPTQYLH